MENISGQRMLVTNQLFPNRTDWKEVVIHGKFAGRYFSLFAYGDGMSVQQYTKAKPIV